MRNIETRTFSIGEHAFELILLLDVNRLSFVWFVEECGEHEELIEIWIEMSAISSAKICYDLYMVKTAPKQA